MAFPHLKTGASTAPLRHVAEPVFLADMLGFSMFADCLTWVGILRDPQLEGYWGVVLKNVKLGGDSVMDQSAAALIDTGTSMIVGPFEDVGAIAAEIGALCIRFIGETTLDPEMEEVRLAQQSALHSAIVVRLVVFVTVVVVMES